MAKKAIQITGSKFLNSKEPEQKADLTKKEQTEKDKVDSIISAVKQYEDDRADKTEEWMDCYEMYQSHIDTSRNPFMANLFIPKTHEAVELLAAFLIGNNQAITVEAENKIKSKNATLKATLAEKYLDFIWRKVVKARLKILTFIKQGAIFGNGIIKVGWETTDKVDKPFLANTAIEDIYFDFFVSDIQDSEWIIHKIRKSKKKIESNENYIKSIRETVVEGGAEENPKAKFSQFDSARAGKMAKDKVVIFEAWERDTNKVFTIAPTSEGYRILREMDNPNKWADGETFRPFVKLKFKVSPLPNRGYDTGAVFPTINIQKAFNDLMNEYFDNVSLINNKTWITRRGAKINPMDLVRRPGSVIEVSDINKDIKSEEVSDIKPSIVEELNRLDSEFQQASMVVNILKGVSGAEFATEIAVGQSNVQTILGMISENINDALSEVGQMLLVICATNAEKSETLKVLDKDNREGMLEFNPKNLKAKFDVQVIPDRDTGESKIIRQKQLIDFLSIISKDVNTLQRYPNLPEKIYKKWLEEAGFNDLNYFFEKAPTAPVAPMPAGAAPTPRLPAPKDNLTKEGIDKTVAPTNLKG